MSRHAAFTITAALNLLWHDQLVISWRSAGDQLVISDAKYYTLQHHSVYVLEPTLCLIMKPVLVLALD